MVIFTLCKRVYFKIICIILEKIALPGVKCVQMLSAEIKLLHAFAGLQKQDQNCDTQRGRDGCLMFHERIGTSSQKFRGQNSTIEDKIRGKWEGCNVKFEKKKKEDGTETMQASVPSNRLGFK